MRRRHLLASLAGVAGLSGCMGGPSGDSPTPTQGTDTPSPTPTTGNPAALTTRAAIGYWHGDDSYAVEAPEADLFAFVELPDYDGDAPASAFTLELGSEQYSSLGVPGNGVDMPGVESVYGEDGPSGPLLFDLPTVAADSGALVGDGTRYPLAADTLESLASAPAFEVSSVSVTETVTTDEQVSVSAEVTNTGDRAGEFFAAVRWAFEIQGYLQGAIEPGKTATIERAFEHDGSTGTRYGAVHYPGGDTGLEVTVEES